jgi:surface protein
MKPIFIIPSILLSVILLLSCGTENKPTYKLTTNVSPSEGGTITPSTGVFSKDEVVELTGVPTDGWRFVRWEGDWSGETNPSSIVMNKNYNVVGIFTENPVYLSENGVTIMCPNGKVGDVGVVNGVEYKVVDRETLLMGGISDLSKVCTSLITDMSGLFRNSPFFNQPIGNWDVSNVIYMNEMFDYDGDHQFNQPIGDWDVSSVTNMNRMFGGTSFNQPIGNWNVSSVTNMGGMFSYSEFNQPIGDWNVSSVTDMIGMFGGTSFNQPIGNWDVSSVTNMSDMFHGGQFNQPIGDWDVSNVTNMYRMFIQSQFNQPIGSWNVSKVTNMTQMFQSSQFNQNIFGWCVTNITNEPNGFSSSFLLPENKPIWGTCPSR